MTNFSNYKICIINGYPEPNRKVLKDAGVKSNEDLYADVLKRNYPGIKTEFLYIADLFVDPYALDLKSYQAFIWTGSNLTIYHTDNEHVSRQIRFCKDLFELGSPQYGSCWSIQMATVAAGGIVEKNPAGREWCLARAITLTKAGKKHPLYAGKPHKFDAFMMHLDHVSKIPDHAVVLATNKHTPIQAMEVKYKNGTFWAQQYHPEYNLKDMARLIFARTDAIAKENLVPNKEYLLTMVKDLEAIAKNPDNKMLRDKWQIGDDVLDTKILECEIRNFFERLVFA
ncbi:MAG: type 1 glutamine amidotransferase [Deltaproteobacteria bacterium]|nr:type 1 glutamine amidotransferase [Deltaproteobacteria bacterium]